MKVTKKNFIKKDKKSFFFNKKRLVGILILFIVTLQVFFTVYKLSVGNKIVSLEKEKENLGKENKKLQEQLVELSSLTKIDEKSEILGFNNAKTTIYLKVDEIFAGSLR